MNIPRSFTLVLIACALSIVSCAQTDVGVTTAVKAKMAVDGTVKNSKIEVFLQ